jgi:hypothetical protein
MAELSVQEITIDGTVVTFAAAAGGGDTFPNTGKEILVVKNDSASSITVTIDSQAECSFGFDHDPVITVGAGVSREIGPFKPQRYNDADGMVNVSYSAVTTVTVAVKRLTPAT